MVFHILLISTIGKLLQVHLRIDPYWLVLPVLISLLGIFIFLLDAFPDTQAASAKKIPTSSDTSIVDTTTPVKTGDATVSSKFVVDEHFIDPDNNCEDCTRMVYTPGSQEEAGIAYKDSKLDMGNSQRVVFFARAQSNEQVAFVAAGNDSALKSINDTDLFPRINFSVVTDNVTLKKDWQRFEIGLNGSALSDATYPFGIQLSADSPQKQVFYIKGITLDDRPAQNPLHTEVDFLNSTSINSTNTLASASVNSSNILTSQINANSTNSPAPATIKFGANASGGLLPYSYSWNFGDGANGTGIGEKVLHTFNKSGHYTITLAAKDSSKPPQNATAIMLVTISSSTNKTDVQSLTTQNGTTGNNENTTIGTDANGTISNNANSTVGVPQSTTIQSNRTNNATQNAIGLEGGSSNQVSSSKAGGKNFHELSRALGKNFTLDANNANDVSSVNHPPVAMDQSVIVYTNKATSIVLRGTDPDKDPVKFEIASDPLKGVLVGFNKETGAVTYIPNPASPGEDSFTFKVIDIHNAESNVARVSETIVLIPTVGSDGDVGTDVGPSHQSLNSAPLANDDKIKIDQKKQTAIVLQGTDVDHDELTYSIVQGPSHGKLIAFDPSTGKLSYKPNDNFVGQDVFTFKATDQKGLSSNAAKVEIMVNGGVKGHSNIHVDPPSLEKAITDETSGSNVSFARNSNPSVNAGPDRAVYAGTKDIILKGTATDLDDDLLTYSWKQTAGLIVELNSPNSAKSTFNVPVEVDDKVLRFVLLVSDGRGGHDTDEVKISIRDKDIATDQPFQSQIQRRAIINQTSQLHR